jgi:hypothetical protein
VGGVWCAAGIKLKSHAANHAIEDATTASASGVIEPGATCPIVSIQTSLLSFLIFTSGLNNSTAFYFDVGSDQYLT